MSTVQITSDAVQLTTNATIMNPAGDSPPGILHYLFGYDDKGIWQPSGRSFQNDGKLGNSYIHFIDTSRQIISQTFSLLTVIMTCLESYDPLLQLIAGSV